MFGIEGLFIWFGGGYWCEFGECYEWFMYVVVGVIVVVGVVLVGFFVSFVVSEVV